MPDVTQVFIPESQSIKKIFTSTNLYVVPDYQRRYSWEDEQVEQLWDDLLTAFNDSEESYFLGPTIFTSSKDGRLVIVDGQQRLTTLTILFCVLRDFYLDESSGKTVKMLNEAVKSYVEDEYRISLRLMNRPAYQNEFEQDILKKVQLPANKRDREKSNFKNTAEIFYTSLMQLKNDNDVQFLEDFTDYIFEHVVMITITCTSEDAAIKLFQIINTRGLDLSNADLIKSHLYMDVHEDARKQFISDWDTLEKRVDLMDESLSDLFTYYEYYLIAKNPKRALYEEIMKAVKGQDPNTVLFDFKNFVDSYEDICDSSELKDVINSCKYLPNQIFWKSILTTAKKSNFSELRELCKLIRKLYYCFWIAGYTTSKTKQLSFNLIQEIKNGAELSSLKDIINEKLVDDNVANRMLESLTDNAYGKMWLKPLLIVIDNSLTDPSKIEFVELNRKLQAEHILPDKWRKFEEWKQLWNEEDANYWLNKLGNLTLLSGTKNNEASNNPWEIKRKAYEGKGKDGLTSFRLTQDLLQYDEWSKLQAEKRQGELLVDVEIVLEVSLIKSDKQ